jgi:para-aminobenzoate synthetase/4-amino-4-deoxychorismate lyase
VDLGGPAPTPDEALRRLNGWAGRALLWGAWAGGGALLFGRPLLTLPAAIDARSALAAMPPLVRPGAGGGPLDTPTDIVGGGWVGWLGYDRGEDHLAFYDHVLRWDPAASTWSFESLWSCERADALAGAHRQAVAALERESTAAPWSVGEFVGADRDAHLAAVEGAIGLIRAGEIYQVNVCARLHAPFSGDLADLFADSAAALRPRYGAFVDGGARAVASLSPELFLRRRGRMLLTSPIKGTLARATDSDDGLLLRRSAKDSAENIMIVDLMRNDFSRVCRPGSVTVDKLLDVEPHPGLWHLVSSVSGELTADTTDSDVIAATFPPGSVTGAPKKRAIQAAAELEGSPRRIYTGAIGFASPSWGLEFNVAIRTFEASEGHLELGIGGGITVDSVPIAEWRECLDKAAPLLRPLGASTPPPDRAVPSAAQLAGGIFETILVVNGIPVRLADHLARLNRSCAELFGAGGPDDLAARAVAVAAAAPAPRSALRITAMPAPAGVAFDARIDPAPAPGRPRAAVTVPRPNGCWRHKWADRTTLNAAETDAGDAVPLFVNGETVLETSRGNVFILRCDGNLVTAPQRDDLLPGVTRRAVLDLARDRNRSTEIRPFTIAELRAAAGAFWTSSLSGLVPITSVNGYPLSRCDELFARWSGVLGFAIGDHAAAATG